MFPPWLGYGYFLKSYILSCIANTGAVFDGKRGCEWKAQNPKETNNIYLKHFRSTEVGISATSNLTPTPSLDRLKVHPQYPFIHLSGVV